MEIKFFYVHMFSKQHINIIISTPQNKSNATLEIKILLQLSKKTAKNRKGYFLYEIVTKFT